MNNMKNLIRENIPRTYALNINRKKQTQYNTLVSLGTILKKDNITGTKTIKLPIKQIYTITQGAAE